jgi:hypothetical protein
VVGFISHLQCCQKSLEVGTNSGPLRSVLFLTTGHRCFSCVQPSDMSDKSLVFLICSTTKRIFLAGLRKLEQWSDKCVELRQNM